MTTRQLLQLVALTSAWADEEDRLMWGRTLVGDHKRHKEVRASIEALCIKIANGEEGEGEMIDHMQARDPNATCNNCPWYGDGSSYAGRRECRHQTPKDFMPTPQPSYWCSQHPLNKIAYEKFILDWRDTQHESRRLKWEIEAQEAYSKNVDITSEGTTA